MSGGGRRPSLVIVMPDRDDSRLSPPGAVRERLQVTAGVAALRAGPQPDAEMVSQALHGETVGLVEERGGFALVQAERDRYVGWADAEALSGPVLAPTHRVRALRTYVFSEPDLKSAPRYLISLGAGVVAEGEGVGDFVQCARAGWVFTGHLGRLDAPEDDPAGVAERFRGAPYLWGGCESLGLDCTGLTRAAFEACGVTLPRDSDMQFDWAGEAIADWEAPGALRRGDLVFWRGHVGIMLDAATLLHANAFHMAVAAEPLSRAIERIAPRHGRPTGARRIDLATERGRRPDWLQGVLGPI